MAAYGALVSVMQIIYQIQHHPRPPISLHKEQVQSLTANISFLQEFLEGYNPRVSYSSEADPLESRIAEAAYAAEDVIESFIVDQIHAQSKKYDYDTETDLDNYYKAKVSVTAKRGSLGKKIQQIKKFIIIKKIITIIGGSECSPWSVCKSAPVYHSLQKVIEEMDLIKTEVAEMKERTAFRIKKSTTDAGSSKTSSTAQRATTMVGFDDVLYEMLDKITGGGRDRQIIPIVGMGGIGKTTLAQNIYVNSFVTQHFDVCAWSTVSQEHNTRKILSEILDQVDKEKRGNLSEYELGEKLYRFLIGRRYLIVMDDMWGIEAWDGVARFFPNNGNGSRIVITTRLLNLASELDYSNGLEMNFLDEGNSWNLFSKTVFGDDVCPLEFEDIGKRIVKGCKGLPLSIVVIGGLLSKARRTRENWESVDRNLVSIVNTEGNDRCLQILYTSYNNLPVYIKPCFLYMGVYSEDYLIEVFVLISLWVAEGFLKPLHGKTLEEVGEEYLEELVDRNLVLVEQRNYRGRLHSIKIHDLLRDLCLREAQKEKFLCVLGEQRIPQDMIKSHRRIGSTLSEYPSTPLLQSLESASPLVRSLIGKLPRTLSSHCRLLRVSFLHIESKEEIRRYSEEESKEYYKEIFLRLANLRHLLVRVDKRILHMIPSSISFMWNLQTLILSIIDFGGSYELDIWRMPLLRHVITGMGSLYGPSCFPDHPPPLGGDHMVLENLQTLSSVRRLNFSERVLKTIPNIKWLDLSSEGGDYNLKNLRFLHKLEVLSISISLQLDRLAFPCSLKELTLKNTKLPWEEMQRNIGSLPLLQVLNLRDDSFTGPEWETVEGQFSSLKFLEICHCTDLKYWTTDNTHFPRLERLVLSYLPWLREVPLSIGDIPTLRVIELYYCSFSADDSAQRILEEQEESGNEGIQLRVDMKILPCDNFFSFMPSFSMLH